MLRRLLLLGLTATSITGCAPPVNLGQSNRDPVYQRKLERVLVTKAFFSQAMTDIHKNVFITTAEIKQSFAAKWAPLGVSVEVLDLDILNNSDERKKAIEAALVRFGPTQVLELKIEGYRTISYVIDGYVVDAGLLDVATKKRVWRATVEFNSFERGGRLRNGPMGAQRPHQTDADDLVDTLTAKFKSDGLIR